VITGRSHRKDIVVAAVLVFFAVRMLADQRIPLLSLVDLGSHELGRIVTYPLPTVVSLAAASIMQVAVPFVLAMYFFIRDEAGTALCLGWTASNCLDVARYMSYPPHQQLPVVGGGLHDWSLIFGRSHLLERSAEIAELVRVGGWALFVVGIALLVRPYARMMFVRPATPA
jgi:hypothetical protein